MVKVVKIVIINDSNVNLINEFIENAGDSLNSFRYFKERSLKSINNHLYTCVLVSDGVSLGYGHLDLENDIVWLGIAIAQGYKGRGFGKKIMLSLINFAERNKITKIRLSVDVVNSNATNLYKSLGFKMLTKNRHNCIMQKDI